MPARPGCLPCMRILFASTRGAGHFGPLVPFAQALLRAGDDVLVAAPRSTAALVASAGLDLWPCDDPPERQVMAIFSASSDLEPHEAGVRVVREVFAGAFVRAALPGLGE